VLTLLAIILPLTPVHCHTTGERWEDPRSTEELLEIGAVELCNGGGIRQGSKITDEQRQVVNTIIVVTVVAAATTSIRRK
jgi:hypothetical protein